jgi:hypothetical protein
MYIPGLISEDGKTPSSLIESEMLFAYSFANIAEIGTSKKSGSPRYSDLSA